MQAWLAKGYKVEVIDPKATKLNEKYHVYQDLGPIGHKLIIINEHGQVIGAQG